MDGARRTGGDTLDNRAAHPGASVPPEVTRWQCATLTINSKNYGAWSLRGWLLCKMSGLEFDEHVLDNDDPDTHAELLLLSSSFLVPTLVHDGVTVWDTMAIGEYLNEVRPDAGLLPSDDGSRGRTAGRSAVRSTRAS